MSIKKVIQNKFVVLIKSDIRNDIVSELMKRFEDEIVIHEDIEDPMRPSICREEFKLFLEETIKDSIKIKGNVIEFGIDDQSKLGIGERLDEGTTDCLRIIGTILGGIAGRHVLVFKEEVGQPVGRTGKAFLLARKDFDKKAEMFGWQQRSDWKFSNFPGINLFDGVELDMDKYIKKVIKELK